MSEIPHLQVPFRIVGGHALVVEQDTLEEISQNLRVLLLTRRGQRGSIADYGVDDPTFGAVGRTPDEGELQAAAARWEPRARIDVDSEPAGDGTLDVVVRVGMQEVS